MGNVVCNLQSYPKLKFFFNVDVDFFFSLKFLLSKLRSFWLWLRVFFELLPAFLLKLLYGILFLEAFCRGDQEGHQFQTFSSLVSSFALKNYNTIKHQSQFWLPLWVRIYKRYQLINNFLVVCSGILFDRFCCHFLQTIFMQQWTDL